MRGASSPFTFRSPRNDDFVEEELADDSDMLVITTRQMQLESELDVLRCEKGKLEQVGSQNCSALEQPMRVSMNQCWNSGTWVFHS